MNVIPRGIRKYWKEGDSFILVPLDKFKENDNIVKKNPKEDLTMSENIRCLEMVLESTFLERDSMPETSIIFIKNFRSYVLEKLSKIREGTIRFNPDVTETVLAERE